MTELVIVVLLVIVLVIVLLMYRKSSGTDNTALITELRDKLQTVQVQLETIEKNAAAEQRAAREEQRNSSRELRTEISASIVEFGRLVQENITAQSRLQQSNLENFAQQMNAFTETIDRKAELIRSTVEQQMKGFTEVLTVSFAQQKEEQANSHTRTIALAQEQSKLQAQSLAQFSEVIGKLTKDLNESITKIRESVEARLDTLSRSNSEKLEEMRQTVDEKLQSSIEKRFNESFTLISSRLEQVHKGLGEMQTIATGMEDLKSVFKNVKARGIIGEAQLSALLNQFLVQDQFIANAQIKKGTAERVEFAIKLPGQSADSPVLLAIDAKFPLEDFNRVMAVTANAAANPAEIEVVLKAFENSIKSRAREISEKYISVPDTVDFALMFVPSESIYAEILRRPGLFEMIQREYRVTTVGPVNLAAFLSSLQMGFKTLAIQQRSGDVWKTLGMVKGEFAKFGDVLDKTKTKLEQAVKEIDNAGVRTRAIQKSLKNVETIPVAGAELLPGGNDDEEA